MSIALDFDMGKPADATVREPKGIHAQITSQRGSGAPGERIAQWLAPLQCHLSTAMEKMIACNTEVNPTRQITDISKSYTDAIDDWCDITELDAEKRGHCGRKTFLVIEEGSLDNHEGYWVEEEDGTEEFLEADAEGKDGKSGSKDGSAQVADSAQSSVSTAATTFFVGHTNSLNFSFMATEEKEDFSAISAGTDEVLQKLIVCMYDREYAVQSTEFDVVEQGHVPTLMSLPQNVKLRVAPSSHLVLDLLELSQFNEEEREGLAFATDDEWVIDEAKVELHEQMRKSKYIPRAPIPLEYLDSKRRTIMEFSKVLAMSPLDPSTFLAKVLASSFGRSSPGSEGGAAALGSGLGGPLPLARSLLLSGEIYDKYDRIVKTCRVCSTSDRSGSSENCHKSIDLRKDLARRVMPSDGPYNKGDRVYVWRKDESKKKSEGVWVRGIVVSQEGATVLVEVHRAVLRVNQSKDALQQPLIFLWQLARVVQQYRQYNPSSIEGTQEHVACPLAHKESSAWQQQSQSGGLGDAPRASSIDTASKKKKKNRSEAPGFDLTKNPGGEKNVVVGFMQPRPELDRCKVVSSVVAAGLLYVKRGDDNCHQSTLTITAEDRDGAPYAWSGKEFRGEVVGKKAKAENAAARAFLADAAVQETAANMDPPNERQSTPNQKQRFLVLKEFKRAKKAAKAAARQRGQDHDVSASVPAPVRAVFATLHGSMEKLDGILHKPGAWKGGPLGTFHAWLAHSRLLDEVMCPDWGALCGPLYFVIVPAAWFASPFIEIPTMATYPQAPIQTSGVVYSSQRCEQPAQTDRGIVTTTSIKAPQSRCWADIYDEEDDPLPRLLSSRLTEEAAFSKELKDLRSSTSWKLSAGAATPEHLPSENRPLSAVSTDAAATPSLDDQCRLQFSPASSSASPTPSQDFEHHRAIPPSEDEERWRGGGSAFRGPFCSISPFSAVRAGTTAGG
ncbi:unnamed protein product [Symbiodinium microadriaticum]|nr:unnamed protein product [Symbiodinium microadriaticum]